MQASQVNSYKMLNLRAFGMFERKANYPNFKARGQQILSLLPDNLRILWYAGHLPDVLHEACLLLAGCYDTSWNVGQGSNL